jgi:hypothetical protein
MKGAKPPTTGSEGLKGLWRELEAERQAKKQAKEDGKKLFRLVTKEAATPAALTGLVYQASLMNLILFTLDHGKEVTTGANRLRSIERRAEKSDLDQSLIFSWCAKNPLLARRPFKEIRDDATSAINSESKATLSQNAKAGLRVQGSKKTLIAYTTIRSNISLWRKRNPKN